MKKLITIILLLLAGPAWGATIVADSCSHAHVQAAIDASNAGDTVSVPSGDCTWTTQVEVDKGIWLSGAGIDVTTITGNVPTSAGTNNLMNLKVDVDGSTPWRVSGFTFTDTGTYYDYAGWMSFNGNAPNWRMHDIKFDAVNGQAMRPSGNYKGGLIYDCQFIDGEKTALYIRPTDASVDEDTEWTTATTLGDYTDAITIEDCTFTNTDNNFDSTAIDGEYGVKIIFRHNTCTNMSALVHGWESHRSAIRFEVSYNTFIATTSLSSLTTIVFRGGTGVAHDNTITGTWWLPLMVRDYCACGTGSVCQHTACSSYPCTDQVGRTSNQVLAPIYQWDNTYQGGAVNFTIFDSCSEQEFSVADAIQVSRDIYNAENTGYTEATYPHPLRATTNMFDGIILDGVIPN